MIIQTNKPLAARRENDHYPTPLVVCRAALNTLPRAFTPSRILDPGAGTGVWGMAACEKWPGADRDGVEIRADAPAPRGAYTTWYSSRDLLAGALHPDYCDLQDGYDLVIGNPPYSYAQAFVERSIGLVRDGGRVVFLLRLAFLESTHRHNTLFGIYPPKRVSVLVQRPSFMPAGDAKENKTDATAYAIFDWQRGYKGSTELHWLSWR